MMYKCGVYLMCIGGGGGGRRHRGRKKNINLFGKHHFLVTRGTMYCRN